MSALPAPFIVGVGRSGTTLLWLMLDAHPEVAIPTETHFVAEFLSEEARSLTRESFERALTDAPTWPNMAMSDADLARALATVEPFTTAEGLRAFYRAYAARFGKARWGDKTPPYRGHMAGIAALLPEARFIHLIRDGRDVALSYQGLWFGPGDDIDDQARFWTAQIAEARRQAETLPHYLEVRYEALVTRPEATLRPVCEFLELPYDARMLEYASKAESRLAEFRRPVGPPGRTPKDLDRFLAIHERTKGPPDAGRIGGWRIAMSEADQRRYEAIARRLLAAEGYETRF